MITVKKLNKWTNSHNRYYLLDVLRLLLGGFIFYKGMHFMVDSQYITDLIAPGSDFFVFSVIAHYVALAHIAGGILIVLGLMTRIAVAFQIPILIGAVAVNFFGTMIPGNLIEASIALILSVFFLFAGSGKHSVDYMLKLQL